MGMKDLKRKTVKGRLLRERRKAKRRRPEIEKAIQQLTIFQTFAAFVSKGFSSVVPRGVRDFFRRGKRNPG